MLIQTQQRYRRRLEVSPAGNHEDTQLECSGFGESPSISSLKKKILRLYGPQLVFLSETKLTTMQMNMVVNNLNFKNCFAVNCSGRSGGITMLWNLETCLQIKSFSKHHINAEIQMTSGKQMRCTGVYGHPEANQKNHTWTLLRRLAGLSSSPWLCFGDYNEILHPSEKSGGNDRNLNSINEFREALRDCELMDVGYTGYPFTWSNGRFGSGFVEERLDRFACNKAWSDFFVDCAASNLDTWSSDHCPMLMVVHERDGGVTFGGRHSSRFHYEDMWGPYAACKDIIKEEWSVYGTWSRDNPIKSFQKTAKNSMARLLAWSKGEFGWRDK